SVPYHVALTTVIYTRSLHDALPISDYVAAALQRVPLRIHQDIIVTDQMLLDPADEVILLPAQTRYEQDDGGTETSTERRIWSVTDRKSTRLNSSHVKISYAVFCLKK